jgi:hypothetical protein
VTTKKNYISAGRLQKIQNPFDAEIEYAKTAYLYRSVAPYESFRVANPAEFNKTEGRIGFDYINGLVPIKFALCLPDERDRICAVAAEALATIHCLSDNYVDERVLLPEVIGFTNGESCFIHGDFNQQNVCWSPSEETLVILDWSLAPIFRSRATHGTPYFDLGWFIYNIFSQSLFRFPSISEPGICSRVFLLAYFAKMNRLNSRLGVSIGEFLPYLRRLVLHVALERRTELNYAFWHLDRFRMLRLNRWIDHMIQTEASGVRT